MASVRVYPLIFLLSTVRTQTLIHKMRLDTEVVDDTIDLMVSFIFVFHNNKYNLML